MIESTVWERLGALGLIAMADETLRQQQRPSLAPLTVEECLGLVPPNRLPARIGN